MEGEDRLLPFKKGSLPREEDDDVAFEWPSDLHGKSAEQATDGVWEEEAPGATAAIPRIGQDPGRDVPA